MEYKAIIYKITNLLNGKVYIGKFRRKTNTFYRYWGGGVFIKRAIKKYGISNFAKEIIVEGNFSLNLTNELEKHYIRLYNSNNPKIGYNLTIGGDGCYVIGMKRSDETKKRISEARKKIKITPEHLEKLRQSNIGRKHKKGTNTKNRKYTYKKIYQYSLEGFFIKEWCSMKEISKQYNYSNSSISNSATGRSVQAYGFLWVYRHKDVSKKLEKIKHLSNIQLKRINGYKHHNINLN